MESGKVAMITGATAGIGKSIALAFAEKGVHIAACARTQEDLEALKKELETLKPGIEVLVQSVNVRHKHEIEGFVDAVREKWGRLDILVNNAGIFLPGSILDEEDGNFEKTMETNLYSSYYASRAAVPLMKTGEPKHIFNMCSIASITAYANGGSYAISKWGQLGFNQCLREELKEENIKVTALLPGATWSRSWKDADFPEERLMQPEDIAKMVVAAWQLPPNATVEEIIIRPQLGDL